MGAEQFEIIHKRLDGGKGWPRIIAPLAKTAFDYSQPDGTGSSRLVPAQELIPFDMLETVLDRADTPASFAAIYQALVAARLFFTVRNMPEYETIYESGLELTAERYFNGSDQLDANLNHIRQFDPFGIAADVFETFQSEDFKVMGGKYTEALADYPLATTSPNQVSIVRLVNALPTRKLKEEVLGALELGILVNLARRDAPEAVQDLQTYRSTAALIAKLIYSDDKETLDSYLTMVNQFSRTHIPPHSSGHFKPQEPGAGDGSNLSFGEYMRRLADMGITEPVDRILNCTYADFLSGRISKPELIGAKLALLDPAPGREEQYEAIGQQVDLLLQVVELKGKLVDGRNASFDDVKKNPNVLELYELEMRLLKGEAVPTGAQDLIGSGIAGRDETGYIRRAAEIGKGLIPQGNEARHENYASLLVLLSR